MMVDMQASKFFIIKPVLYCCKINIKYPIQRTTLFVILQEDTCFGVNLMLLADIFYYCDVYIQF
jgi:hypothetical protein